MVSKVYINNIVNGPTVIELYISQVVEMPSFLTSIFCDNGKKGRKKGEGEGGREKGRREGEGKEERLLRKGTGIYKKERLVNGNCHISPEFPKFDYSRTGTLL